MTVRAGSSSSFLCFDNRKILRKGHNQERIFSVNAALFSARKIVLTYDCNNTFIFTSG